MTPAEELAEVRRILGVPDGVPLVDHADRVARALADVLSPLAPWPAGWVVVPEEGIVALDRDADGECRAYVCTHGWDEWRWHAGGKAGTASDMLTAIADCMAVLGGGTSPV
jgi:hypothetical protein